MKTERKTLLAVTLLVCMIFMSSIFAALGSLMDPVTEKFGVTGSAQGLPGIVSSVGGICVFAVSLFLIGRIRKTTLLALGIGLCAVPLCLMDLAESYPVYILLWTVTGFGLGFMDALLSSCMADLYTGKTGTRMMCILHTFFGVTSMLAPLLFSALLTGGTPFGKVYQLVGCFGALIPCMLDTACANVRGNTMLATTVMMLALYLGQGISPTVLGWFDGPGPGLVHHIDVQF